MVTLELQDWMDWREVSAYLERKATPETLDCPGSPLKELQESQDCLDSLVGRENAGKEVKQVILDSQVCLRRRENPVMTGTRAHLARQDLQDQKSVVSTVLINSSRCLISVDLKY